MSNFGLQVIMAIKSRCSRWLTNVIATIVEMSLLSFNRACYQGKAGRPCRSNLWLRFAFTKAPLSAHWDNTHHACPHPEYLST